MQKEYEKEFSHPEGVRNWNTLPGELMKADTRTIFTEYLDERLKCHGIEDDKPSAGKWAKVRNFACQYQEGGSA